jgi:DNA-binding protein H-NS
MIENLDLSRLRVDELEGLARRVAREIMRRGMRRRYGGGLVDRESPTYRNPENPAETWAGRGARPAWLTRAIARGRSLDSLRD